MCHGMSRSIITDDVWIYCNYIKTSMFIAWLDTQSNVHSVLCVCHGVSINIMSLHDTGCGYSVKITDNLSVISTEYPHPVSCKDIALIPTP